MVAIKIDEDTMKPTVYTSIRAKISDRVLEEARFELKERKFAVQLFECWMTLSEFNSVIPLNKPLLRCNVFEVTEGKDPVKLFGISYQLNNGAEVPYYSYDLYGTDKSHKLLETISITPVKATAVLTYMKAAAQKETTLHIASFVSGTGLPK